MSGFFPSGIGRTTRVQITSPWGRRWSDWGNRRGFPSSSYSIGLLRRKTEKSEFLVRVSYKHWHNVSRAVSFTGFRFETVHHWRCTHSRRLAVVSLAKNATLLGQGQWCIWSATIFLFSVDVPSGKKTGVMRFRISYIRPLLLVMLLFTWLKAACSAHQISKSFCILTFAFSNRCWRCSISVFRDRSRVKLSLYLI